MTRIKKTVLEKPTVGYLISTKILNFKIVQLLISSVRTDSIIASTRTPMRTRDRVAQKNINVASSPQNSVATFSAIGFLSL